LLTVLCNFDFHFLKAKIRKKNFHCFASVVPIPEGETWSRKGVQLCWRYIQV